MISNMDITSLYAQLTTRTEETLQYLKQEFLKIRTGKPNPSIIEDLEVNAYQGQAKLKLKELASISIDPPTSLLISPFDTTVIKDIESSIHQSNLNLSTRLEGTIIRVLMPPLTLEQRESLTKIIAQKTEECKERIRIARDDIRKQVQNALDDKTITEDDKFRAYKEIDTIAKNYTDKIEELKNLKTQDILTI